MHPIGNGHSGSPFLGNGEYKQDVCVFTGNLYHPVGFRGVLVDTSYPHTGSDKAGV